MSFWKHLAAVAVGAAAGVAVYFLTRDKQEQEHIVGPEAEVETDPTAAEPEADAPAEEAAPAQTEAEAAQPETAAETAAPAADDTPNVNPVALGAEEVPTTEDGKLDPAQIAKPEDFANWDDVGCQG